MKYDYRNLAEKHFELLDQETIENRRNTLVEENRHREALDRIFAMVNPKKPVAVEHQAADREYHRRYTWARRHLSKKGYSNPDEMAAEIKSLMAKAPEKQPRHLFIQALEKLQ